MVMGKLECSTQGLILYFYPEQFHCSFLRSYVLSRVHFVKAHMGKEFLKRVDLWFILLYTRNQHNTVNQLYSNNNFFKKKQLCKVNWKRKGKFHFHKKDLKVTGMDKLCSPFNGRRFIYFFKFIYFNWRLITLQYCIGFAIHQHESSTGVHVFLTLNPHPTSLPVLSLWVVSVHQPQASSIMHRTWTGDSFHIWYYTCFNAILPNHPTLTLSHRVQ